MSYERVARKLARLPFVCWILALGLIHTGCADVPKGGVVAHPLPENLISGKGTLISVATANAAGDGRFGELTSLRPALTIGALEGDPAFVLGTIVARLSRSQLKVMAPGYVD